MPKKYSSFLLISLLLPLCSCNHEEVIKNTIGFHYYYNDSTMTCRIGIRQGFNLEEATIGEYFTRIDENGIEKQYKITGIYISDEKKDYFLKDNKIIKKLIIDNPYITTMPYDLFRNSSLEFIDCSKATALEYIGDHVFENSSLKEIILPPNLKQTYKGVFSGSKIETISFPSTYIKMDIDTFFNCPNLKEVNFNDSLEEISGSCFEKTPLLEKVTGGNIKIINSHAFRETPLLKSFDFSHVNTIQEYAFYHSGIESVSLKDCYLGSNAFNESNLKEVSLENVSSLPYKVFGDCPLLTSLSLKGNIYEIGPSAFKNDNLKEINLPDLITFIGSEAFLNNKELNKVHLSTSLESISTDAFKNCSSLSEISFPSSLKRIRDGAFINTSLKSVTLSKEVELLGKSFDEDCIVTRL